MRRGSAPVYDELEEDGSRPGRAENWVNYNNFFRAIVCRSLTRSYSPNRWLIKGNLLRRFTFCSNKQSDVWNLLNVLSFNRGLLNWDINFGGGCINLNTRLINNERFGFGRARARRQIFISPGERAPLPVALWILLELLTSKLKIYLSFYTGPLYPVSCNGRRQLSKVYVLKFTTTSK